jgi:hypothetical protein
MAPTDLARVPLGMASDQPAGDEVVRDQGHLRAVEAAVEQVEHDRSAEQAEREHDQHLVDGVAKKASSAFHEASFRQRWAGRDRRTGIQWHRYT